MVATHWLDLVILAYGLLGLLRGMRQGFIAIAFSLAGYVMGVILAGRYQAVVTALVLRQVPLNAWVPPLLPAPVAHDPATDRLAFTLAHQLLGWAVFLLIVGAVEVVGRTVGRMASAQLRAVRILRALNGLGGSLAGLAEHLFVVALAASVALSLPFLRGTPLVLSVDHSVVASTLVGWFNRLAKFPPLTA